MSSDPLEILLDLDRTELQAWQSSRFDTLAGPGEPRLVLHGAGGLGLKTLEGLRRMGLEPLAFCDNNPGRHGTRMAGVEVLAPAEAVRRFGDDAVFLVTVFVGGEAVRRMLQALGCRTVLNFHTLYWKRPDLFLPHYSYDLPTRLLDSREEVIAAGRLMADSVSSAEYLDQVRWRLDPDAVEAGPPENHPIYFPPDLFSLSGEEVFVDCGAYIGDTLLVFLREVRNQFRKAFLLEPDPRNLARLQATVAALPLDQQERIEILPVAVADAPGTLGFSMHDAASALSATGEVEVPCRTLDELLGEDKATFLKMDVEGAELLALAGATEHIRRHRPLLAISAYHCQDHLWKVPLFIHRLDPGYRFHLRRYSAHFLDDLVLYAVPGRAQEFR